MEVKRLRTLGLEIFKTLSNLNPASLEVIIYRTKRLTHRPNNVQVNLNKTTKYGDKSLRIFGPYIWNSLLDHMKAEVTSLNSEKINQWSRPSCKYNMCVYVNK